MKNITATLIRIETFQGDGYKFFDAVYTRGNHTYRSRLNEANVKGYVIGKEYSGIWYYAPLSQIRVFEPRMKKVA